MAVAEWLLRQIVDLIFAGSNPVGHPRRVGKWLQAVLKTVAGNTVLSSILGRAAMESESYRVRLALLKQRIGNDWDSSSPLSADLTGSSSLCYHIHMAQTKEQHRIYMIERYHRLRNEWIESQGGECVQCGSCNDLEIDHVNPEHKLFSVGKLWSISKERRTEELKKCQLLCSDCHKKKTARESEVPHGGGVTGKGGCRCDPCRLKKNEYLKLLKRERRAKGLKN